MQVICNRAKEDIDNRLRRIDLVCTDLDECLFPFFTQVLVAGEILFESFFKRNQWKYLPRLIAGFFFLLCIIVVTLGDVKRLSNKVLMKAYERTMSGIPLDLIKKHSQYVHTFFYAESLSFLKLFADKNIPIVILSLSIQPVLDILKDNIGFIHEGIGNSIEIDHGTDTFSHYAEPMMTGGNDKHKRFMKIISKYNTQCPLIIGHSSDELSLVSLARERGGLSIGINPKKRNREKFDIVLQGVNWRPLIAVVMNSCQ
ncbi:MAG: haloacid dehalogenase-like hydrolase [Candidatus Omnitrophica bacterium]|nr:haloacid dehalogenase-like hydrolase [Candidatus Omnitrophota bacterium]